MLNRIFGYFGRMIRGAPPPKPPEKETKSTQSQTDQDKKWTDDKILLTQELEDTKKYYEGELAKLREKLKDAKSSQGDGQLLDSLRDKSAEMRENYEAKIVSIEGRSAGDNKQEVVSEVKRIMSSVYHSLKNEFDEKAKYDGADINSTIMDTIKSVTLQLIQAQEESTEKKSENSEVSEIFVKEASPVTGNRGNPYYAAELEKKQKEVVVITSSTKTESSRQEERVDIVKKVELLKTLVSESETNQENQELDAAIEPIIEPVSVTMASPTGGRGNFRFPEELDNGGGGITQTISFKASSSVTGATGNIYREEEILRKAKAKDIVTDVITAAVATNTGGGGGNPYYSAELTAQESSTKKDSKDKDKKPTEKEKPKVKPEEKPKPQEKTNQKNEKAQQQEMPKQEVKPSTETAKKAESVKPEKTKTEPPKSEKPKTEPPKSEKPKTEPPKSEKPKTEPAKSEKPKTEPAKSEKPNTEPTKSEKPKTEPAKSEKPKTEPTKSEKPKTEPAKAEKPKTEPAKSQSAKSEPTKKDVGRSDTTASTDDKGKSSASSSTKPVTVPARHLDSDDDLKPKPPPLFDEDYEDDDDDDWLNPKIVK